MMRLDGRTPILLVYYFLLGVGLLQIVWCAYLGYRALTVRVLDLEVRSRTIAVDVFDDQFVTTYKVLMKREGAPDYPQNEELPMEDEEVLELRFLNRFQEGAKVRGLMWSHRPQELDFQVNLRWGGVMGLTMGAVMFLGFAWFAKPFATGGNPMEGMFKKTLVFILLVFASALIPILAPRDPNQPAKTADRKPVTGFLKTIPPAELAAALAADKVTFSPAALKKMGATVRFCEYEFNSKTYRSASLYCQPLPGVPKPGMVNPARPWDVIWEGQPAP